MSNGRRFRRRVQRERVDRLLPGWTDVHDTSRVGAMNAYHCELCGALTVTIDVDAGVTPMFLGCRATDGCSGRAVSEGYIVPPGLVPEWEWFRPTPQRARRLGPEMLAHVAAGGLELRRRAA